jgi:hypothetical protein
MRLYDQCACGEARAAALVRATDEGVGGVICGNCDGRSRGRPLAVCVECGELQPIEAHHVDGRGVSEATIALCVNDHRAYHAGQLLRASHPALRAPWAIRLNERRIRLKE